VAEHLVWVPGGEVSLPIHVSKTVVDEQPNEPDIRVGLYSADTTNNQVQLTADGDYLIVNGEGKTLAELDAGDETTITFSQDKYHCTADGTKLTSNSHIRFVPAEGQVVFELLNYEHRPAWNTDLNDNNFRSKIEVRYSTTTEKLWVINELPLEQYLRGVAEASNDDYPEYLKALIVAERTYAQYHLNTGTKHADEHYTIDATYDQVYRGYNFEVRAPKIADQIDETTGLMVTYEDEVVVTPYFSHTDGRTRSWEEVWSGGPYPWLTSVPDPASEGLAMLGHGVGLSALGARDLASEGSTYDAILSYFYQDIVLKIIY
ncbi:hypothetical protein KKG41_03255, partial [Patescibacteria group bacterium]|nr:hypothetical protein [Patescibacteria group bacterium]MBU1890613.1 hypothetical protein [Patescibacteria group bacterium]